MDGDGGSGEPRRVSLPPPPPDALILSAMLRGILCDILKTTAHDEVRPQIARVRLQAQESLRLLDMLEAAQTEGNHNKTFVQVESSEQVGISR